MIEVGIVFSRFAIKLILLSLQATQATYFTSPVISEWSRELSQTESAMPEFER